MATAVTVDDLQVRGQRVLVRVDFNVPMRDGAIVDDRRIRAALPTITTLLEGGARVVVVTHLGRPKGTVRDALRVGPLATRLAELLGVPVAVAPGVVGADVEAAVDALPDGGVLMLENVRFEPGEEQNDPALAAQMARLADVYVNDAFGTAHRAHASTEGVAHHLPAVAGRLMARELVALRGVLDDPRRPLVSILGGAKISSKIGVLRNLLPRVDTLWVGGAMACTFYRALGEGTGISLVEEDQVEVAGALLGHARDGAGGDLRLPVDLLVAPSAAPDAPTRVVSWKEIGDGDMVVDVGPETVDLIATDCDNAGTVVWNGPLGIYEVEAFAQGTRRLARRIADSRAITVIGGGDLAAAIADAGVADRISHISTGGGATLEFLEGRELPGVTALWDQERLRAWQAGHGGGATEVVRRVPLIAGNWKMHTTVEEGIALARAVRASMLASGAYAMGVEVAVLPPFTHLWPLRSELDGSGIALGAQNCAWQDAGALTGETSPASLRGWCTWVLLGHSERRHVLGETDEVIARKLRQVLTHDDLQVLLAVGETLEQREADDTRAVVERQLASALEGVDAGQLARVVIAYEPVWAIGTGRTATPEQAQAVCALIRAWVDARYASNRAQGAPAERLRILYGGSVTAANAQTLLGQPDIDGGLIGGASLDAAAFASIVAAARPLSAIAAG